MASQRLSCRCQAERHATASPRKDVLRGGAIGPNSEDNEHSKGTDIHVQRDAAETTNGCGADASRFIAAYVAGEGCLGSCSSQDHPTGHAPDTGLHQAPSVIFGVGMRDIFRVSVAKILTNTGGQPRGARPAFERRHLARCACRRCRGPSSFPSHDHPCTSKSLARAVAE